MKIKKKHPAKCKKCGGRMGAYFSICRVRRVKADGTLGNWTDGGTYYLDYYECEKCEHTEDAV